MSVSPYVSLIVPAYNEAGSICRTLGLMQAYLDQQPYTYEIIVSADGDDGTRELMGVLATRDPRISVIGSAERGGKGRGIRNGVALAQGQIIGFVDADYKTPIEEIDKLLPWLDRGYDLVIGSRGMAESQIEVAQPLYRQLGSRAFAIAMHIVIGLWNLRDTQCGFKFFRGDIARDLFSRQQIDGYMFDVEILHLAERSGYRIKEAGVRWHDDGDSRLDLVAGNWRNMLDILRIRFSTYPQRVVAGSDLELLAQEKEASA
jgi:glycosyltransferase involved in cell wall biosynthesis